MIGIAFRNLLAWALCVLVAAALVVPAVYVTVMGVVAEQNSTAQLFGNPVTAVAAANLIIVVAIAVILTFGWLVARIPSLWTVSALIMALPATHLATKLLHLPAKFMEAWTPLTTAVPDWGWWTAFGVAVALYLFCGPFGKGAQQPEPEPTPAPKKK